MIVFDQLRISNDGKNMYITLHVNTIEMYSNVYLDTLTITTSDKVLESAPTSLPTDFIYKMTFDDETKTASISVDCSSFLAAYINYNPATGTVINVNNPYATVSYDKDTLSKDMFFVYVQCKVADGTVLDPCVPCPEQSMINVGVTFDTNGYYQQVMQFTRELQKECSVPQGFTDFVLLWNALQAALQVGYYTKAIEYYNMLFGNPAASTNVKNCGCHG